MHFTRLRLQGFKSFVDATEMVIAPGLTGVVGPNGCGKSNLLEALRWVMGETSPKAMRGGGMEDVIFAGAASRPARAFAEVALSLDNSARRAPVAFNDNDALEVTRRIARDLGSAYRLNGKEVRARDIRMLFADAATGAHSPALVRQGRISELVNAKPQARRAILEEAAGVAGLHQRRHEAELKLDAAARNLARVDEVLDALNTRLAQLNRQAGQAKRYRTIAAALRQAELALLLRRVEAAAATHSTAERALQEAAMATARALATAGEASRVLAAADEALGPVREETAVSGAVLQRLMIEQERLVEREEAARTAAEDARNRVGQLETDLAREAQLEGDAAAALQRLDDEIEEIAQARSHHGIAAAEASATLDAAVDALTEAEVAHQSAGAEAARITAERRTADSRLAEAHTAEQRARKLADDAATSHDALAAQLDGLAAAATTAQEAAAAASAKAQAAADNAEQAETARAEVQREEDTARAAAAQAAGDAAALASEVEGLRRLLTPRPGTEDQMLNAVSAAPGYEAALGAALGEDLTMPPAPEGGSGWASLDTLIADAPPAGLDLLAPQVTAPEALSRRLSRIALVDAERGDALQAALAPGWRLVSKQGDLWRWDGLRQRASDAPTAAAQRLEQRNRLTALDAQYTATTTARDEAEALHQAALAKLAEARQAEATARTARRTSEGDAATAAKAQAQADAALSLAEGRIEALAVTAKARAEDADAAAAVLKSAEAAAAAAGDPAAAAAQAEATRSALAAVRERHDAARRAAEDLQRREAGRVRRLGAAEKEREGWGQRLATTETRRADLGRRLDAAMAAADAARAAPVEIHEAQEKLAVALEEAKRRLSSAEDAQAEAEATHRAATAAGRAAETAVADARTAQARAEALVEGEAARLAEAEAALIEAEPGGVEAIRAALAEMRSLPADVDAATVEIARLTRQRDALGAVNLRAEEDAAEVTTERDALQGEKADLEEAIQKLRRGVAELNREGRQRLIAAFDDVNRTFRDLFTHLFGGGEANLELIESDDPLEAGLEIMAMPPGKKLSTLSLLSGGEQTLTALALIFAVFLVNPAPICVLDEVDAPLDDANVGRFCDLLDEMTRRTQTRFLIITHHAVTMSRMDRLFGVTMVEPGVSQLVSVDLVLAAEMAAE